MGTMDWRCRVRSIVIGLLLLLRPGALTAQAGSFSLEDVERMLKVGIVESRVLMLVAGPCLTFDPALPLVQATLRRDGASPEFLRNLERHCPSERTRKALADSAASAAARAAESTTRFDRQKQAEAQQRAESLAQLAAERKRRDSLALATAAKREADSLALIKRREDSVASRVRALVTGKFSGSGRDPDGAATAISLTLDNAKVSARTTRGGADGPRSYVVNVEVRGELMCSRPSSRVRDLTHYSSAYGILRHDFSVEEGTPPDTLILVGRDMSSSPGMSKALYVRVYANGAKRAGGIFPACDEDFTLTRQR